MRKAVEDVPAMCRGVKGAMTGLAAAILLASIASAGAQVPHNGPEWDGKDHQPTQSEVVRRENQAGIRPPKAQVDRNRRTVQQLGRQLLHDEAVDRPTNPLPR